MDGQAREGTAACFLGERAACAVQGQTREWAAPRHRSLVRSGGRRGRGDQATGSYENFLKASRSKAVSSRRCSSVRWVFLLPVAGAAAGSRPAYLRGGDGAVRAKATERPGPGPQPRPQPTTRAWRGLWWSAAGASRSRSSPGSCAPPGTRPARPRGTSAPPAAGGRRGTGTAGEREGLLSAERLRVAGAPWRAQGPDAWSRRRPSPALSA